MTIRKVQVTVEYADLPLPLPMGGAYHGKRRRKANKTGRGRVQLLIHAARQVGAHDWFILGKNYLSSGHANNHRQRHPDFDFTCRKDPAKGTWTTFARLRPKKIAAPKTVAV